MEEKMKSQEIEAAGAAKDAGAGRDGNPSVSFADSSLYTREPARYRSAEKDAGAAGDGNPSVSFADSSLYTREPARYRSAAEAAGADVGKGKSAGVTAGAEKDEGAGQKVGAVGREAGAVGRRSRTGGSLTKGLECVRVDQLDRAAWLSLRRRGVGGSDAAAVAGESRYSSPYVVWAEKTGRLPDKPDTEAMRLGRDLEDYVARRFTEQTGRHVRRMPLLLRNPRYPFALADIDRAVLGERAGLECKTTSVPDVRELRETAFPPQYRAQCLHYLAVTGWDRWYLAVLALGRGFFVYRLDRDEAEIARLMEKERRFWTEHVVAGKPPLPDGSDASGAALAALWPHSREKTVPLADWLPELEEWARVRAEKRALEGRLAETENRLKAALGDAERGEAGRFTVLWRSQKRRSFQPKALELAHPELELAPFWKETELRALRISEANDAEARGDTP